jgi:hypothetical protein
MPKETYDDLLLQLGDAAREHLADSPKAPPAMQVVFDAEDHLLAERQVITKLETKMNNADAAHQEFLARCEADKVRHKATVQRYRSAVIGVEGRSLDLRKKISSQKATLRYQNLGLRKAEERHRELALREGHDFKKVALSQENLKKTRLLLMRMKRNIEEFEYDFKQVLTPRPGQQGAQGILAHKRLLEMEDEMEDEAQAFEEQMQGIDAQLHQKEEDIKAAEESLDQAIYELGEAVYSERVPHPQLNPIYAKLDKA